jgi:hypothetical protein
MLGLLGRTKQKQRCPRWKTSIGGNYHCLAILALLGSIILVPGLPLGVTAAVILVILAIVCFLTIILAPMGCFLL